MYLSYLLFAINKSINYKYNNSCMGLTKHQEIILEKSLEILSTNDRLLIKGSAGVGKTFLVNTLIKKLKLLEKHKFKKSLCTAPTNKAVEVLRTKVDKDIPRNMFTTVHSALKLKREICTKTGEISFKPSFSPDYPPLVGVSILIIDEASMLSANLLSFIEEFCTSAGITVIFLGDFKQLPPVNEIDSPAFTSSYPEVELTEIVRQGEGNPIIKLSRNLSLVKKKKEDKSEIGGYTFTNDLEKIIYSLAHNNGTDKLKYLAWTNEDVDKINKLTRLAIFEEPKKIELNETLVFNVPFGEEFFTNQEIKVDTLEIREKDLEVFSIHNPDYSTDNLDLPEKLIEIFHAKYYMINGKIPVIHEDCEKDFSDLIKKMKKLCKDKYLNWKIYFNFVESFADLKYNHAQSVHKSQGSTYQQVIINVKNLNLNKNKQEREKLLYTAITRASQLVILYNA